MWTCNVLKCARFAKISPNVVFASTSAPWWDIGETRVNINWGCSFISSSTKVAISSSARTLHGHHSKSCASVWSKGKFWEDKSSTSYYLYVKYNIQGFEHDQLTRRFATATINNVMYKIGKWRCVVKCSVYFILNFETLKELLFCCCCSCSLVFQARIRVCFFCAQCSL